MHTYRITIYTTEYILKGKTPLDAFRSKYPDLDLMTVKEPRKANVKIECISGKRKTCNYYLMIEEQ